jgi:succinyl-diaminopimelate desuccinylase
MSYEVDLLEKLISIDTDVNKKTGYVEMAEFLKRECEALGLNVKIYDGANIAKDGYSRPNVAALLNMDAEKTLMLISHYDVVPPGEGWSFNPFKPIRKNDLIFGRGASDDKSAIAAALGIAKKIQEGTEKAKRNLLFLFTCDEEIGGNAGLGYLINEVGLKADEALIMDAGYEAVYIGASGILTGEIKVKGVQGHAGYPFKAINPIYSLAKIIVKLEEYSILREKKISKFPAPPDAPKPYVWGRFSVTMLRAGEKSNIIPGEASAIFDLRLIPEENVEEAKKEFIEYLKKVSNELNVKLELTKFNGGGNYYTDVNHPFVKNFKKAVEKTIGKQIPLAAELGGNDGRYTSAKNIPTICFGPIAKDSRFHGVDEFVRIKDVLMVKDAVLNYILKEAE